jgi:hypothetical protein
VPITFIPNPNGGSLGVGLPLSWNSDVGDTPDGAIWRVIIFGEGGSAQTWLEAQRPRQGLQTGDTWFPFIPGTTWNVTEQVNFPVTGGQAVHATVSLIEAGVVTMENTLSGTWDATSGLPMQIEQTRTSGSGGFTAADRTDLQAIEVRSQVLGQPEDLILQTASGPIQTTIGQLFSRQLVDTLTLQEVTSGPTSDPVRASFGLFYYGVIVRVTTIAEDLVGKTPDGQWYFPDLAVLRIIRGADLESRHGIHTPTAIFAHPWETGNLFRNTLDVLGVPPDRVLAVDWREGCAGQVFLQIFP